jgi:hypothetical protein
MDATYEPEERIRWDPNHPVDQAFARWAEGIRPIISGHNEIRDLVGAMQGVSVLLHLCAGSASDDAVEVAVICLHELCSSAVAIEEVIVLGGLQVRNITQYQPYICMPVRQYMKFYLNESTCSGFGRSSAG